MVVLREKNPSEARKRYNTPVPWEFSQSDALALIMVVLVTVQSVSRKVSLSAFCVPLYVTRFNLYSAGDSRHSQVEMLARERKFRAAVETGLREKVNLKSHKKGKVAA